MTESTTGPSNVAPGERPDPHAADPHAADPHASDATTGPHGSSDDHGADHGHDDHAHAAEAVGPVDLRAWAAGILGVALGLLVAFAIAIASGSLG